MEICYAILFVLIIIDYMYIGFAFRILYFFKLLKIVEPLKRSDLKRMIIEDTLFSIHQTSTIRTNLKKRTIDPSKQRVTLKSIILTPNNLIVRNTFLTCYFKVKVDLMTSYEITKKMIGTEIKLNIIDDQNTAYFIFRTKKVDKWIDAFDKVNIELGITS